MRRHVDFVRSMQDAMDFERQDRARLDRCCFVARRWPC